MLVADASYAYTAEDTVSKLSMLGLSALNLAGITTGALAIRRDARRTIPNPTMDDCWQDFHDSLKRNGDPAAHMLLESQKREVLPIDQDPEDRHR